MQPAHDNFMHNKLLVTSMLFFLVVNMVNTVNTISGNTGGSNYDENRVTLDPQKGIFSGIFSPGYSKQYRHGTKGNINTWIRLF